MQAIASSVLQSKFKSLTVTVMFQIYLIGQPCTRCSSDKVCFTIHVLVKEVVNQLIPCTPYFYFLILLQQLLHYHDQLTRFACKLRTFYTTNCSCAKKHANSHFRAALCLNKKHAVLFSAKTRQNAPQQQYIF
ncbi:Hypothetical_protein [Hexamita inflata]|uniref:Hypothetical_protein n=1 Tax=Hexamita inflata TaxID=28002 RepID=A0AA86U0K6_9EUKA|nr:Hypothetical protein HINF_LOCUS21587 [Hexamita inflata]